MVLLLGLHLLLQLDGARRDSATFDEPLFLAGGIASWQGAHHLFPEGGALPQRLAGLPLALAGATLPRTDPQWAAPDGWGLGFDLLRPPGERTRTLIFLARLPVVLASVLLGWALYATTRRLLGEGSALVALALHASSPAFLAHGHLATADLLAAATLPASAWLASRCLQHLTWPSLLLSCLALSLAFLAKMSAILVPPAVLLVVGLRLVAGAPTLLGRSRRCVEPRSGGWLAIVAGLVLVHALAVVLAAWAAHDFRYAGAPHDALPAMKDGGWEFVEAAPPTGPLVRLAREHRVLPEAWLFGLQYTVKLAEARRAYAEGRYSLTGWRWFFPRVVALKTPLVLLLLLPLGMLAFASSWRRGVRLTTPREDSLPAAAWARRPAGRDVLELAPLLAFAAVYGASAVASALNLGLRHVLPILPILFLACAASWRLAGGSQRRAAVLACLTALAVAEGLSSYPHHLAWMNAAGGPPARRFTHFVDSSLDWGQGLRSASRVVAAESRDGEAVYLSYFGSIDPASEGLHARGLASFGNRWRSANGNMPGPGLFLISATALVQLNSRSCPGRWRPLYERAWQASLTRLGPWREASPEQRFATLSGPGAEEWLAALAQHDDLVAGRLCSWLRQREPLRAVAGGAMLLYRLDARDVQEALHGPPRELVTDEPVPFPAMSYDGTPPPPG